MKKNAFVKPNEQSDARISSVMASKVRLKFNPSRRIAAGAIVGAMSARLFLALTLVLLFPIALMAEQNNPQQEDRVTLEFRGESLSEALRQIDHAQSEKNILFLFDDLEMYNVRAVINRLTTAEAVRKVCGNFPVSIVEDGDNIFVEYVPKIVHLNPVVVNGDDVSSLREKVSLHIDSISCFQGETIRFTVDILSNTADSLYKSRVLYVDLLSPDGVLLQQQKLPITESQCHGSFVFAKKISLQRRDVSVLYPSGLYQLRAYTRQMLRGSAEGNKGDGLVLDGWVVDKGNHPLEGVTVTSVIEAQTGIKAKKVKMKSDRQGYWSLPLDDFYGACEVGLSLDKKKNRRSRIVVRQSLCNDLSSQLAEYGTLRAGGVVTDGYLQSFDILDEENARFNLGLKSVSVADFLTEKGFKIRVDYSELSYSPNEPPTTSHFYTEEDYGSINTQRLDQTDGIRFRRSTPSLVTQGTYVNGHPARWNIEVPKDFPTKIYDREITYTRDVNIKYVKSILLIDYEPTMHPYVYVSVVLRNAEEIGKNGPEYKTVCLAGYSIPADTLPPTPPGTLVQGDKENRRIIQWNSDATTDSTGCTTLSFSINNNKKEML